MIKITDILKIFSGSATAYDEALTINRSIPPFVPDQKG